MMLMNYHSIVADSLVDGPGHRTAIFMQGCPIQCPGCQNQYLWPDDGENTCHTYNIAMDLSATGLPITITGGEPFFQPEALADLVIKLKMLDRHIIVYSGFTYEDLMLLVEAFPEISIVLALADILVDGPYIEWLDHDGMQYRGSSNQRVIDLRATNFTGSVVTLDWDTPELIITADGDVLGAEAVVNGFAGMGQVRPARRCGQVNRKGA